MKKKVMMMVATMCAAVMLVPHVSAQELECTDGDLNSKITSATAGDTIKLTDNCTATSPITVNKTITINGDSKMITGTIEVTDGATLTLENVTVKSTDSNGKIIKITSGNLTVRNSKIYYNDENNTDFGSDTTGIFAQGNAIISVYGSSIHAKYGIWAKGSNNVISVTNSNIHGYGAIDISNGSQPATGNTLTVVGSTVTGHHIYDDTEDNSYAAIVFAGQSNGSIYIGSGSTVSNVGDKKEYLIAVSGNDTYPESSNNNITIEDSTLINNSKQVTTFDLDEDSPESNVINLSGNVYQGEGKVYPENSSSIYVTVVIGDSEKEIVTIFKKDTIKEELSKYLDQLKADYEDSFDGYYKDSEYGEKFTDTALDSNTVLYLKLKAKAAVNDKTEENPDTSDNASLLFGLLALGVCGLGLTAKKRLS